MSHRNEPWFLIYRDAMVELEHAKMAGRIGDARTAITERAEKLKDSPGFHAVERQAIEDALSGLRMLEQEEERYRQNEEKHLSEPNEAKPSAKDR